MRPRRFILGANEEMIVKEFTRVMDDGWSAEKQSDAFTQRERLIVSHVASGAWAQGYVSERDLRNISFPYGATWLRWQKYCDLFEGLHEALTDAGWRDAG